MNTQDELYIIPNYQFTVGILSEFDPSQMMSCVYEDVNVMLNFVLAPALGLVTDGNIPEFMGNSLNYITRELAARGKILNVGEVTVYGAAVATLTRAYIEAVSSTPTWFTRHAQWLGARYHSNGSGAVEFMLRYGMVKLPQLSNIEQVRRISPEVTAKLEMLIGRLGAAA